jgi:hypothetical protein
MTVSYQDFQRECRRVNAAIADAVRNEKQHIELCQRAYLRGLQRKYHGKNFCSDSIHNFRMQMKNSKDPEKSMVGSYYVMGYEFDLSRGGNHRGRKKVGDCFLSALWVHQWVKDGIEKLHEKTGESKPDMRKRWEEEGLLRDLKRWRVE